MSSMNVELVRRLGEGFNAHDIEAIIALCDPSVEWHSMLASAFTTVGGGVYHGHDGLRTWHKDHEELWEEYRGEPEALFDLGEYTLAILVLHGRGKHSGAEVAAPVATVARWRDGLLVYFKAYQHREDALSYLGVKEDALEPIGP
jgi:ketosteroid isomerase-like protein